MSFQIRIKSDLKVGPAGFLKSYDNCIFGQSPLVAGNLILIACFHNIDEN